MRPLGKAGPTCAGGRGCLEGDRQVIGVALYGHEGTGDRGGAMAGMWTSSSAPRTQATLNRVPTHRLKRQIHRPLSLQQRSQWQGWR